MASNHKPWPMAHSALYGLLGGIILGIILTALRGNLDNTSILVSAVLSGAGLCTVLALLLAWLRNFVRGAM
jgi:hypothetical protein